MLKCLLFSPSSLTTLLEDGGEDFMGEVWIILGGIWLALPTPRYPGVKYDDLLRHIETNYLLSVEMFWSLEV